MATVLVAQGTPEAKASPLCCLSNRSFVRLTEKCVKDVSICAPRTPKAGAQRRCQRSGGPLPPLPYFDDITVKDCIAIKAESFDLEPISLPLPGTFPPRYRDVRVVPPP